MRDRFTDRDLAKRLASISQAATDNFVELAMISNLDPARDFRNADFEGVDFSNCDLRGFDFTGSDFSRAVLGNASFRGAITTDARFAKGEGPRARSTYLIDRKRNEIVEATSRRMHKSFITISKTLYESSDRTVRFVCTVSRELENRAPYWFAYHPKWDRFLDEAGKSFLILGCLDLDIAFEIPTDFVRGLLASLNRSKRGLDGYWHLHVNKNDSGDGYMLIVPRGDNIPLSQFEFPLK